MQTKICPDCGDDIGVRATTCKCGWRLAPAPKQAPPSDADAMRCGWNSDGQRCRYVAGIKTESGDRCTQHFGCASQTLGAKIVAESIIAFPNEPDFSCKAVIAAARKRYLDSGPIDNDLTDQQWYNVCKFFPSAARHCKRTRPAVGVTNPLDATAHEGPLFRVARVLLPKDTEADAERRAIQAELPA